MENNSKEDWTDINVAPFVSSTPITTRDELAEAAAIAGRRGRRGPAHRPRTSRCSVGDLAPGQKATFTVRVPVGSLADQRRPGRLLDRRARPGRHEPPGRDLIADGRARTFIPLVPQGRRPRRARCRCPSYSPCASAPGAPPTAASTGPARWVRLTRPQGRLTRLADFGVLSRSRSAHLAGRPRGAGRPPGLRPGQPAALPRLRPAQRRRQPVRQPEPRHQPRARAPPPRPRPVRPVRPSRPARPACWTRFLATVRTDTALNLGYADPDVASLARRGPRLLRRAEDLSAPQHEGPRPQRLARGGPAAAGTSTPTCSGRVPSDTLVLLSDQGRLDRPAVVPAARRARTWC